MKNRFIILSIIASLLAACYEDKGNYTYGELESIQIENVEQDYKTIYLHDRLVISPEIETSLEDADLKYAWTFDGKDEILSDKVVLDTFMNWQPGNYRLLLTVTNANTGYTVYKLTSVAVNTEFTEGWYVLKDNGQVSDFDLYTPKNKYENLIRQVNGDGVEGVGQKICVSTNHRVFDPDHNSYRSKKVLFALTDKDINGIDAMTAHRWRKFEDLFFEIPKEKKPQFIAEGMTSGYFLNDGKVYPVELLAANNGKFLGRRNLDGDYENYYMSKYIYLDALLMNILVYDEKSSTFYTSSPRQNYLTPVQDEPGTEMSAANTGKKLLYMGNMKSYMGQYAYAVFQDKKDPTLKMMSKIRIGKEGVNLKKVKITNDTLDQNSPAYRAERYTISQREEVMYFVADNKVYSRNVGGEGKNGAITTEYEIPAGERMTFIKSHYLAPYKIDYFILGTEKDGQYKIRCFKKTTAGHLDPVPDFELPRAGERAEGRASDVVYTGSGYSFITPYIPTF